MHKVNDTSKNLTVFGLVVEGLALLAFSFASAVFTNASEEMFEVNGNGGFDEATIASLVEIMHIVGTVFVFVALVILIGFAVNLSLFTKLLKGRYDETRARRVLFYQALWGCLSLLFNVISGILYIVSAIKALTEKKEDVVFVKADQDA